MQEHSPRTKFAIQRACIWIVPVMIAVWLGAFLIAGFLPVPQPSDDAAAVAEMYDSDRTAIRIGLALTIFCATWLAPFVGIISAQMRRIEGRTAPLAYAQLAMGALLILEFVYPMMMLQVAAYREERPAELVQTINDLGWMLFIGVVSTVFIQFVLIALAIFQDDREDPVFPRWVGYFNIWTAAMMLPGSVLPFFKTGPFAWNGLIDFWLVASAFTTWLVVMSWALLRAISQEEREEAAAAADPAPGSPTGAHLELRVDSLGTEVDDLRAELQRLERALASSEARDGKPSDIGKELLDEPVSRRG